MVTQAINLIFQKTLQIGDGRTINKITGIKTVNNFREQDVKLGGPGCSISSNWR